MTILGIETSCDETAAAVVVGGRNVLSNVVASQADFHAKWGGVIPEAASRMHVQALLPVVHEAIELSGCSMNDIDGIAVTNRPGLVGALLVGVTAAKALSFAAGKPIVGIHHLHGHIHSGFLEDPHLEFPFICLIVSGGHTELLVANSPYDFERLGGTVDDAAGECFDKSARLLGLPYPGGPHIDRLAAMGSPKAVMFPRARMGNSYNFSFSGLKTAVKYFVEADGGKTTKEDIAASLQAAIIQVLVDRTVRAVKERSMYTVVVAGGVAANQGLKLAMSQKLSAIGAKLVVPRLEYCTDNAAMIAAAGHSRLADGDVDNLSFDTFASASLYNVKT